MSALTSLLSYFDRLQICSTNVVNFTIKAHQKQFCSLKNTSNGVTVIIVSLIILVTFMKLMMCEKEWAKLQEYRKLLEILYAWWPVLSIPFFESALFIYKLPEKNEANNRLTLFMQPYFNRNGQLVLWIIEFRIFGGQLYIR